MKILMIGWGFGNSSSGGMDVHITGIVKSLCKKGIQVHLFLPEKNAPKIEQENLTIHTTKTDPQEKDTTKLIEDYNKKIIKYARTLDFDMIHTHDWLGVPAAKELSKKKPWVHTVHSLEHMRCGTDKPKKGTISETEKTAIKDSDAIITVSNLMKSEIMRLFKIESSKITVIYNYTSGLRKNSIKRDNKKAPQILCVSRLTFQKGIEYLIYASKDILKEFPQCRFTIVGDGHLKKSLEEFAKVLGVANSFEFTGFVPQDKLENHFINSDLFVMPSIYEPFGIACLDAIEYSLPVVMSQNTGAKELFEGCVLTHKPRSSKDIAEKVTMLLKDRKYSKNMAEKAKQKLKEIDEWSAIAKKTLETYYSSVQP